MCVPGIANKVDLPEQLLAKGTGPKSTRGLERVLFEVYDAGTLGNIVSRKCYVAVREQLRAVLDGRRVTFPRFAAHGDGRGDSTDGACDSDSDSNSDNDSDSGSVSGGSSDFDRRKRVKQGRGRGLDHADDCDSDDGAARRGARRHTRDSDVDGSDVDDSDDSSTGGDDDDSDVTATRAGAGMGKKRARLTRGRPSVNVTKAASSKRRRRGSGSRSGREAGSDDKGVALPNSCVVDSVDTRLVQALFAPAALRLCCSKVLRDGAADVRKAIEMGHRAIGTALMCCGT